MLFKGISGCFFCGVRGMKVKIGLRSKVKMRKGGSKNYLEEVEL